MSEEKKAVMPGLHNGKWGIDPSEEIYDTREEHKLDREIIKQSKEV